ALKELAIAQRSLPNDSDVYMAIGAIERRQGKWADSTQHLEKAVALDPKNGWTIQNLAFNYMATRDYDQAEKVLDRGIEVAPESFALHGLKAKIAIEARGDVAVVDKMLTKVPAGVDPEGFITFARINILMLQRRFQQALALLE